MSFTSAGIPRKLKSRCGRRELVFLTVDTAGMVGMIKYVSAGTGMGC
jgi:hypothetical protein